MFILLIKERKKIPVVFAEDDMDENKIKAVAKGAYEPVTGLDRATIIEQFAKMEAKKKKGLWQSTILPAMNWAVPLILTVLLLTYYGNIATTLNGATDTAVKATERMMDKAAEYMREARADSQGVQNLDTPIQGTEGAPG